MYPGVVMLIGAKNGRNHYLILLMFFKPNVFKENLNFFFLKLHIIKSNILFYKCSKYEIISLTFEPLKVV
jgi:hypothetical protein